MSAALRNSIPSFVFFLFILPQNSPAQTVSGTVRDAATRDLLPAASVRLVGTDIGTIANADGNFRISLPPGRHQLAFSYVGYSPESLSVELPGTTFLDVRLRPSPVRMAEVVISGEDPAIGIMRRVIQEKKEWMATLESYTLEAFTRQMIRRDTSIATITESYTTGYWKRGDTLREVVRQKRQTENVPVDENFASVGRILNFYDDEIRLAQYRFIGPTSEQAFEYYGFRLEETRETDGRKIFVISLNPSSRTTPLFRGTISVVDRRFVLASVDVEPNEAFSIPLIPDFTLRYAQQFAPIQNRYWLPVDIRVKAAVNISVMFITFPPMKFESISSIYDYEVNSSIPDTVFTSGKRVFEDSTAAVLDSSFWAEREVLPLTREQELAFADIDSTLTMEKVFKPSTPIGDLGGTGWSVLDYIDARFTRVEGAFLGGKFARDSLLSGIDVSAAVGYGFADKEVQWSLSALRWGNGRRTAIGLEAHSRVAKIYDEGKHFALENSFDALLYKNDYFDYYQTSGGRIYLRQRWGDRTTSDVGLLVEEHRTRAQTTNFSIFSRSKFFRPNPAITDGSLRSIQASISYETSDIPFDMIIQDRFAFSAEVSDNALGSDFDFIRLAGRGTYRMDTFLDRSPFPAYLTLTTSAGWTHGSLPVQRHFTPETQSSSVGPLGVIRGGSEKEFAGKQFVLFSAEHNFRNVPFLWTGIPFLYEQNWDLIVFVTAARTVSPGGPSVLGAATRGFYTETGIGINHLFKILRADLTYRMYAPRGLHLTFSMGQIL